MSRYADRARAPRTLTHDEQAALLRATGATSATYRDHCLVALALGTGLREFELVALDCGDVLNTRGKGRQRVELTTFKQCTDQPAPQYVIVPDPLRHKLTRYGAWKRLRGQPLESDAPLFCARGGRRLSTRRVRELWAAWRELAELSPRLTFHALRHTYCQNLYDVTRDLRLVMKAARHANVSTTTRYAEPSTDDQVRAVQKLRC